MRDKNEILIENQKSSMTSWAEHLKLEALLDIRDELDEIRKCLMVLCNK